MNNAGVILFTLFWQRRLEPVAARKLLNRMKLAKARTALKKCVTASQKMLKTQRYSTQETP